MEKLRSQFVTFKARPEATSRLVCFPHAGGAPMAFFPWSAWFGEEIECVCVQYRGRAQRLQEPPLTSVADITAEIESKLEEISDKPFSFYGHSFGGILAFELARRLEHSRLPVPTRLFVGATRPPHLESPFPPIHHLGDEEFIANVQSRYGGIPAVIAEDVEAMKMFLPAMRADFTAYETYTLQSGEPLDLPISAFGGADDKAVHHECLREWAVHTRAGFDLTVLPGGHFFPSTSGEELVRAVEARAAAPGWERNPAFVA